MSTQNTVQIQFSDLNLKPSLLKSLQEIGYETPSPIQAETIPHLLAGKDLVGQAQTGTGKTAAFALPLLSNLDLKKAGPLVLVLTPTRELAIQVAEAFQRYAASLKGFHVLPVYGGSSMNSQIRQLKRGVHVVVGTPGRVMDHMRRGTLRLDGLEALVLDEADEMLRMGFIDAVEWVLSKTPPTRQIALFSATMPKPIRQIARKHLKDPKEITIQVKTTTAETINQRYCLVSGMKKLDVLTKILETEPFEAMLIFVRTKHATKRFAQKLAARGYASAALNGDIAQRTREKTVERFKKGKLDIIVATDVAARGLDVERVSHVINFDIPHDTESYVHRIGRTGRAGREGEAILFVDPRERYLLAAIEKATKRKITLMKLPETQVKESKEPQEPKEIIEPKEVKEVKDQPQADPLKEKVSSLLRQGELGYQHGLLKQYQKDWGSDLENIAAALLKIVQQQKPKSSKPRSGAPFQKRRPQTKSKTAKKKKSKGQKFKGYKSSKK